MSSQEAGLDIAPVGQVTVRTLAPGARARWDAYVQAAPQATFFHLSAWADVIESVFGHRCHYLYAERDGDICAVLPLVQVRTLLFGNALISMPFAVYGGVVADDEVSAGRLEAEAEVLAQKLGVEHLEYRNLNERHADWPRQDLYVTFRKELLADVEANMLAIPRKQRAMVRKGIKNGLVSHIDANVDRFFDLFADNVQRHGTPAMPKRYFEALKRAFGDACELMVVTTADGNPISTVMSFYFRDEVLPYYAGDALAARELAANDFKYWELMRRACERGIRIFDYGRSKRGSGSFDFKKNWGFVAQPLSYEFRLYKRDSIPQNNPSNPKYRMFIAAWKRLPRSVANRLGPYIVKGLG
ncbi:MAG: FemAB family PEP-CTERM system-associated protein [Rhodocyclaceae bacterium]|nr:FemAB family PEP-CTERM system-associated protein [Rhodocyclaceae bacterium]MBX3667645.1 FemAB family PEP-CTERM system-associated protein [Rhodocyclaceae bacterium]